MKKALNLSQFGIIIAIVIGLIVVLSLTGIADNFFKNTTNKLFNVLGVGGENTNEEIIRAECESRCTICCKTRDYTPSCKEEITCEKLKKEYPKAEAFSCSCEESNNK